MSFSRAKLNRFNDKTSDAPSPTRYDPKLGDKGKGGAFSKTERERTVSQSSSDAPSTTCGTPFRTPFSAVKKHSCVAHSNDRLNVVGRPIYFTEPVASSAPASSSVDDKQSLLDLTGALSESHKVAEELRQQNRSLHDQRTELESRIEALETAKADLECVISNNQNCEKQVGELTQQLQKLASTIEKICHEKESLLDKLAKEESNVAKLEDGKIEYETKIVSLEGTLEQVKLEHKEKVDEVAKLGQTCEKLKIANECLKGKIASLEAEVKHLESEMSDKEQTIFALEEKASSLTGLLESARSEIGQQQAVLNQMSSQLKDQAESCRIHEATIYALDLQIGEKQKDIDKAKKEMLEKEKALGAEISNLHAQVQGMKLEQETKLVDASAELASVQKEKIAAIEERDGLIELLNSKIDELGRTYSCTITELQEKTNLLHEELNSLVKEKESLVKTHEEEIFHMQNEWEKKMVEQVQQAEQALVEKDAFIKQTEADQARALREMRDELESMLKDAEAEANRRQSAQLEAGEMAKAKYEARIHDLEVSVAQVLECKARELAQAQLQYNEVCAELTAQIQLLELKNDELVSLTTCNNKLSSRVNNMLEEIKLLNAENSEKTKSLSEMTGKFNEQLGKNDKLSEQLGELDSKISALSEELKLKNTDFEKVNTELNHAKDECNAVKLKNMDLKLSVTSQENRASKLSADLEDSRSNFKAQLVDLNTELSNVKGQCYKFEIALANTRNSLEELGKRLIESECEIDRLTSENELIRGQLASTENEKNDIEANYRLAMEVKIELEQRLKDADETEKVMRNLIKELELKNCDFELTKNELAILQGALEEDKKNYEESLATLQKAVTDTNLQMIESERNWLNHVEEVSETFFSKIDALQRASASGIQNLNGKVKELEKEKEELLAEYQAKREEFEALSTDHDILKTTFDIVTKESQSVKSHSEKQETQLEEMSAKCTEFVAQKNELSSKLEAECKVTQELKAEVAKTTCEKESLKKLVCEQASILSNFEKEIEAKHEEIEKLTTLTERIREEFESKFSEMKAAKDGEIDLLQKEQKEYQARLLSNTDEIISLLANLDSQSKKVTELELENQTSAVKINRLWTDLEREKKAKTQAVSDLSRLQNEVERLTQVKMESDREYSSEISRLQSDLQVAKEGTEWKRKWHDLLEEKEAMAVELLAMTEKKDQYKFHCQDLEKKANAANSDYATAVKDFEELESVLHDKQHEINRLEKMVAEFESLIGPFKEQLELYENERKMLENDRDQLKKQHLEQAAKLGHQNHKQKIQHVVKLKEDILELRHINKKLQCELSVKNKTIENLREELGEHPKRLFVNGKRPTSTPFKGKENSERLSPLPTRVKQEAMSPSNPLRERNQ